MLQPRGRPSLTQDPGLVTNSNLLSREEPTLFPISARARNSAPQRRQADDSSDPPVTQVVQTVSIIQYVNPDGSPRGTSTHYAQPQTVLADPVTGDIIGPANNASGGVAAFDTPETPEAANSPVVPDDSDVSDTPQSPDDLDTPDTQLPDNPKPSEAPLPAVSPPVPESSEAPESLESPEPSEVATPTSIDLTLSADSVLADLPSILPSESPIPSTDGTPDPTDFLILPPDTSLDGILPSTTLEPTPSFPTLEPSVISANGFGNRTSLSSSIASTLSESVSSTTLISSSASDITTESTSLVSPTTYSSPGGGGSNGGGNGGGTGGGEGGGVGGPEVDGATSDDDDGSTPTSVVVGGVVGSVAGAALLIFLVMALFRWRRQKAGRVRLEDGHGAGNRGLGPGAGGSGGGGDGGMAQRSLTSVAPAMLAGMASRRKTDSSAGGGFPTGETGFYRVSGKKLPSVIQHGGDGYTDPRHSTISGASSGITDSQGLDVGPGGVPRLAVGQPMRPISGVPVIRSNPARTPMEEQNPFSDPLPSPPAATGGLRPDAIGRTLSSQDTSRASSSKFTEVL